MIFNHCSKRNYWPFEWFSKSSVTRSFPVCPRGLGHFADSNSIPKNQPTIFHPIQIAAILLKYLLSLSERLCPRCHLSRIDEVLRFADSRKDFHKMFQTPMNCQFQFFFATARGTFVNSFPSPVKSLFCTDRIESTKWQDLEQRQRTGDCFEIHILR